MRDAKTKAVLLGARILVAVDEGLMHGLRVMADPPLQARTDAEGRFALDVQVPAEGKTVWVDAMVRGHRSLSGLYAAGSPDARAVALRPGATETVELELEPGFAVAGVVRDEQGVPIEGVQIAAGEEYGSSLMAVGFTRTDRDGRFEVYDYEVDPTAAHGAEASQARLTLDHPDHVPLISRDLRAMTEAERTSLDLRMSRGLSLEGLVRTPEGGGASGLLLEAIHDEWGFGRSVTTARDGSFGLRGVPRGTVTLRVADFVRRLVGKARVTLGAEAQRVTVDLVPIPGNQPGTPTRLLGLDLVELTEAERVAFELPKSFHVLVVGAGEDPEALGIGRLQAGDCVWDLAEKPVPTVRAFAEMLVSEAEAHVAKWGTTRPPSFRIVYGMRREGGFDGTNTQQLTVSAAQVAELRAWLAAHPK